ncbi:DUF3047 domain-containing protein [Roseococcus sp. SYP-B2431]|uniref:DUF3047 domain-containing protein n=1 Tax=Roseococcus sp. SYP-B2431 TaxID=2496640 RepID=UPI00103CEAA3|nr:DUF3047 domain-containing protein [Roseococcus sp. SYP-B2431]TCI00056.1 DUF3047 domain-containing protein [Roseococcus sp. SYP-B2431]
MLRRTMLAASALGVAARARASVDAGLAAEGWTHGEYEGRLHPATFTHRPGGLAISGEAVGSFVWRRVEGIPGCLAWRWRVDAGPPATQITRRGGDDRAIGITVGFQGWPPEVTAWQRTQHSVAQLRAGGHRLPRSLLIYVWGGTGREAPLFPSPWVPGIARVRVLRPGGAPLGRWFEERVDLAADWRAGFGGDPPPLQEIAIGTDTEDTQARISAMVERISFGPCSEVR